jgi:hypothetical protein
MGVRGRQGVAELSVTRIHALRRPDAPERLSQEARVTWDSIVGRLPVDWFPAETLTMLETYCDMICLQRRMADMTQRSDANVKLLAREMIDSAVVIGQLATKMRLTQQSTHDRKKSKNKADQPTGSAKPWADE